MSADVYRSCLTHALSTEKEEVMGLVIGEIIEDGDAEINDSKVVVVSFYKPFICVTGSGKLKL
jgi:proteasome lid subunit RPN8/RPN11